MVNFMEKTVLITGCSSGFGKALCSELSSNGYYVIASARSISRLSDTVADLKVEMDVTNPDSVKRAIDEILREKGRIDILINNAGFSARSSVEEIDLDMLHNMYEVNVFGILNVMKAVLPAMRACGSGRILNIGSISGRMTGIANGGYCSSKYAVEAITEAARYELSDMGIEVCVIEPGAMDTDFFKTLSDNSDDKMADPNSPYHKIYERDLAFRKKQSRADVSKCAAQLINILKKKKLRTRYTLSVSVIFRLFVKMPDCLKEWGIKKFN